MEGWLVFWLVVFAILVFCIWMAIGIRGHIDNIISHEIDPCGILEDEDKRKAEEKKNAKKGNKK